MGNAQASSQAGDAPPPDSSCDATLYYFGEARTHSLTRSLTHSLSD